MSLSALDLGAGVQVAGGDVTASQGVADRMAQSRRPGWIVVAVGLALALWACGSTQAKPRQEVATPTSTIGGKWFSAPGMAIRFRFPAAFQRIRLTPPGRIVGNDNRLLRTAVGIGPHDLIVVSLQPLSGVVTAANLDTVKPTFDRLMSQLYRYNMISAAGSANGMPLLTWPRQPATLQSRGVTTQPNIVFAGSDEYELQCQATPAHLVQVEAACKEMLATVTTAP